MMISRRYLKGILNADGSSFKILPDEHVNAVNMRLGSAPSAGSSTDDWESVGSTTALPTPLWIDTNYGIGGCWDETANRILFFVWNSENHHRILCWDIDLQQMFIVLLNADIAGAQLGWDKNQLIHSCFAVNGCLYWTDNVAPRRMDVDAGIKTYQPSYVTTKAPYTLPLAQSVIAWIRRPPGLPLVQNKVFQLTPPLVNNFIRYEAFQFMARYQYRNFELSTLGPHSTLADYNTESDPFNRIDVSLSLLEHIEQDVIQVDFVAWYLNTNAYYIIKSWMTSVAADAAAIAAHNAGTMPLTYLFYNDKRGTALDGAYSVKPFDSVPITSATIETAKNRTFQGYTKQGYDTPRVVSSLTTSLVSPAGVGVGGIVGPVLGSGVITGVSIGGTPVVYMAGTPLPIGAGNLGTYATPNTGISETVVISVTGTCTTVRVRYGPGDGTFTNVDQVFAGAGDYTFPAIPIQAGTTLTWICTIVN
jgi:hypothetical protein